MYAVAGMAGTVLHELGHLVAGLAVGGKVTAFSLGGKRAMRFRVRGVPVSLGVLYRGSVRLEGVPSVGRQALFTVAGPLVSFVIAAVLLALALATGQSATRLVLAFLTLPFGLATTLSLIPHRTRAGRANDGARLLLLRDAAVVREDLEAPAASAAALPQPERTDRLLRAYRKGNRAAKWNAGKIAAMLREERRTSEFTELLSGLPMPPGEGTGVSRRAVHETAWSAVAIPGLAPELVDLAASRVQWLLDNDAAEEDGDSELDRPPCSTPSPPRDCARAVSTR